MFFKYDEKVEELMKENVSISLPFKPEYVSVGRLTASIIANQMGFNIEDIEEIKVAVGEACNNAIIHGKNKCEDDNYKISFNITDDKFIAIVEDKGKGFEADKCPEPNLCEPKEGGLGIFIIKSLMDEVQIDSCPGKGTKIKMTKFLKEDI